jgi:hypothetical protein
MYEVLLVKVLIFTVRGGIAAIAPFTKAVVASCVLLSVGNGVGALGTPVKVGDATGDAGAVGTAAATAVVTNDVVAMLVSLSPIAGVGARGSPRNDGDTSGARAKEESGTPVIENGPVHVAIWPLAGLPLLSTFPVPIPPAGTTAQWPLCRP